MGNSVYLAYLLAGFLILPAIYCMAELSTAMPCMGGFSHGKRWQRGTDLSASRDMVVIICIIDEELLSGITAKLENLIGAHFVI